MLDRPHAHVQSADETCHEFATVVTRMALARRAILSMEPIGSIASVATCRIGRDWSSVWTTLSSPAPSGLSVSHPIRAPVSRSPGGSAKAGAWALPKPKKVRQQPMVAPLRIASGGRVALKRFSISRAPGLEAAPLMSNYLCQILDIAQTLRCDDPTAKPKVGHSAAAE